MDINSTIVKINLSQSAKNAFIEFFESIEKVNYKDDAIFMLDGMLAIQMYRGASNPRPEDAITTLTDFVGHVKKLAGVFEKEALS